MTDSGEIRILRNLWWAVLAVAVEEHKQRIHAARRGVKRLRVCAGTTPLLIGTVDEEIRDAEQYFRGRDARLIYEMLDVGDVSDQIMREVTGETNCWAMRMGKTPAHAREAAE